MMISNPSNSLEWMVFLAQKYSSMFIKGTWLTLEIAVIGTLVGKKGSYPYSKGDIYSLC